MGWLYGLAVLACILGTGVMMWALTRGTTRRHDRSTTAAEREAQLVRLQAELDQLRAAQPRSEPRRSAKGAACRGEGALS